MYRIAFIISLVIFSAHTALGLSGSGTEAEPWRIESLADFDEFAADANYWVGYTRLETDVNLSGRTYSTAVIAPDIDNSNDKLNGPVFGGIFDGNDHKITNLTIDDGGTGNDFVGLFGSRGYGETKNLGLEACSVRGELVVGGLVGVILGGRISNCYFTGSVNGVNHVGGLVGGNSLGDVLECYSTGSVTGNELVGGLVGSNDGIVSHCYSACDVNGADDIGGLVGENDVFGSISNCYSTGDVSGLGYDTGGLVGKNSNGSIWNCYSTGDVSGYVNTGGFVGKNYDGSVSYCYSTSDVNGVDDVGGLVGNSVGSIVNCYSTGDVIGTGAYDHVGGLLGFHDGVLSNCYSTGDVSGDDYVGGVVGYNFPFSIISNCFWDTCTQTHGVTESIGYNKGTAINVVGLLTTEMQTKATFTDAGWDFVDIWDLTCEGMNYPRFLWQITPADFLCPHGVDFRDYSFFAGYWGDMNCVDANDCNGTDFDFSGKVDIKDFDIFCGNWLNGAGG